LQSFPLTPNDVPCATPDLGIELCGERVYLMPERALFRERTGTLLVADVHWGKAATFRAAGIAVPGGTTTEGLSRLTAALERSGARRLVFLGDLFHAREGRVERTLAAVAEWRARHAHVEMSLVRGNHDKHAGDPPPELGISCCTPPFDAAPFVYRHHPDESPDGYTLSGHVHPAVRLLGRGRQRTRLPCFYFGARVGILPAFGSFTGVAEVTPGPGDRVFVPLDDCVIEVTG
jgi:DNA ligase-associated metallophosphoesterase